MIWNTIEVKQWVDSVIGMNDSSIIFHSERDAGSRYVINFSILEPNNALFLKILENIRSGITLRFFDYYHPEVSDPGAYVSITKTINGYLYYNLGNHGWSSNNHSITYERAIRYILKNLDYNNSPEQSKTFVFSFGQDKSIDNKMEERVNYCRLIDTGKTIEDIKVYELNNSYLVIYNEIKEVKKRISLVMRKKRITDFIGYYLSEDIYYDFLNNIKNLKVNTSIDKDITVKIIRFMG